MAFAIVLPASDVHVADRKWIESTKSIENCAYIFAIAAAAATIEFDFMYAHTVATVANKKDKVLRVTTVFIFCSLLMLFLFFVLGSVVIVVVAAAREGFVFSSVACLIRFGVAAAVRLSEYSGNRSQTTGWILQH